MYIFLQYFKFSKIVRGLCQAINILYHLEISILSHNLRTILENVKDSKTFKISQW